MAIRTKLTLKGMEQYLEAIAAAGANIDPAADRALAAGAELLKEGMIARAPEETGNLKSKIQAGEPQQDGNFHFIEIGLLKGTDKETARYGNAQEFGTANTSAHPYVRPTMDSDMARARKAMRESLKAEGML